MEIWRAASEVRCNFVVAPKEFLVEKLSAQSKIDFGEECERHRFNPECPYFGLGEIECVLCWRYNEDERFYKIAAFMGFGGNVGSNRRGTALCAESMDDSGTGWSSTPCFGETIGRAISVQGTNSIRETKAGG